MSKIDHDQIFKKLLTTFFLEFLDLFFPEVLGYLDLDSVEFIDKELFTDLVEGEKKVLDVVALAKFQEQNYSFLIHVEAQSSNQTDFSQRFFKYFCSLYLKYNRPIYPIVVFSYDSPQRQEKDVFTVELPYFEVTKFNYKVVQLNRLNWRDFLKQKNPVAAALMAKMRIEKKDRAKVKAECLRLMVSLKLNPAKMQLISGFVDSYLRLSSQEESMFQSELSKMKLKEKEQIMQITTSWKEEGRLEGKLEGQKQGQANTILRLLNRKLGNLSKETENRIKSLESSQLDILTEDLLDFTSFDELQNWLDNL